MGGVLSHPDRDGEVTPIKELPGFYKMTTGYGTEKRFRIDKCGCRKGSVSWYSTRAYETEDFLDPCESHAGSGF